MDQFKYKCCTIIMKFKFLFLVSFFIKVCCYSQCFNYIDSSLVIHNNCFNKVNIDSLEKCCGILWLSIGTTDENKTLQIPKSLLRLKNLEGLNLSYCNFDYMSKLFLKFKNLKHLDISGTKIKTFPSHLLNLPNLEELSISNSYLENFPIKNHNIINSKITILNFANNNFTVFPKSISLIPKLRKLELRCNKISEVIVYDTFKKLETLILENNLIYKFSINAPNLKYLNLSGNSLTSIPDNLTKNCPKLEYLDLSYNKLRDIENSDGSQLFEKYVALKEVLLFGNLISDYERNRLKKEYPHINFIFDETPNRKHILDCYR